ncbi:BadF/BadG/BcrA/BcrD ATPase family protein [Paraglaciecola polaris]|uniref:ATPase, BadF/BadG/BcrA/BcrD type n=1 Tax=Paraglaciecola polaris LMG 21857 TaxID=1129793 RepID=K6ZA43_9ALTE|nr:BadF/BadG/BcrA/BcrD ATPase family protein [Paraglaciecola polaris]GAC33011.1 ATPase, BadF/BadG/BcrA/BcrD type [Paraglaciecola polaris LMG 21857]
MNNTSEFILGLDGGGTKTLARLINLTTEMQWQVSAGASSLSNDYSQALASVTDACRQLFAQASCQPEQVSTVFGLAGAGDKQLIAKLERDLPFDFADLQIVSDAKTSLYGANAGQPVAVVALGTGSVGMRMDHNGAEKMIGGWGFCIGDEGGGAKLGYLAVQKLLLEMDTNGVAKSVLSLYVASQIGYSRQSILQWLAMAKPADYAKLAPHIFTLRDSCVLALEVLTAHANMIEKLIKRTCGSSELPLVLMGGLAEPSHVLLSTTYRNLIMPSKGNSLDGACLLAKQLCSPAATN